MILDPGAASAGVCVLETTGRTSRAPRRLEIWFAAEGDTVYLLSGGRDRAHWVRNLQADRRARLRIAGRWYRGLGRELGEGADDERARQALAAKYQGWQPGRPLSQWAATSLPVAIDLSE